LTIPTVTGRSFPVGRYFVVATPLAGSAQMLCYTVYLDGKRVGAMASLPSESDCTALMVR
jgi:hypothetical protein